MTIWILTLCTNAWVLCGQHLTYEYKNEESCYRALEKIIETSQEKPNFIICAPKKVKL